MYLTDLAFIEEGTPNYTEDGLVNFSKMRMVSFPGQWGQQSPDLSPRTSRPAPRVRRSLDLAPPAGAVVPPVRPVPSHPHETHAPRPWQGPWLPQ